MPSCPTLPCDDQDKARLGASGLCPSGGAAGPHPWGPPNISICGRTCGAWGSSVAASGGCAWYAPRAPWGVLIAAAPAGRTPPIHTPPAPYTGAAGPRPDSCAPPGTGSNRPLDPAAARCDGEVGGCTQTGLGGSCICSGCCCGSGANPVSATAGAGTGAATAALNLGRSGPCRLLCCSVGPAAPCGSTMPAYAPLLGFMPGPA